MRGRRGHRSGWPYWARRTRSRCLGGVRGPGWPATGPERHRPGVVARPAAWYHRSCPECDESCQRQRGRHGAAVEPDHRSTHRPNPCDGLIRTGTQEMAETGRFAASGSARKWCHPPRRSSTCPPGVPPRLPPAPHRGGEIVDQEADHGTGGEVVVVLVAQGRTPRRCLPRGAGRR
jgi:hypothetical protein